MSKIGDHCGTIMGPGTKMEKNGPRGFSVGNGRMGTKIGVLNNITINTP